MWRNASCSLLVVDDDEAFLRAMREQSSGIIRVQGAPDSTNARAITLSTHLDVALVDRRLGHECGIELVRELRRLQPHLLITLISGDLENEHVFQAAQAGADDFLLKPIRVAEAIEHLVTRNAERVARGHFASRDEADRQYIHRVLTAVGRKKQRAARLLGMSRSTLKEKLKDDLPSD